MAEGQKIRGALYARGYLISRRDDGRNEVCMRLANWRIVKGKVQGLVA